MILSESDVTKPFLIFNFSFVPKVVGVKHGSATRTFKLKYLVLSSFMTLDVC